MHTVKSTISYYYNKIKLNNSNSIKDLESEITNFDLIEYYFKNVSHENSFQVISNKIITDIDFNDLFVYLDRTNSKIGKQYMYNKLLTIDENIEFDEQENLISYFSKHEDETKQTANLLKKLNRRDAYYITNLITDQYLRKPKWFFVINLLSTFSFITLILIIYSNTFLLLYIIVFSINILLHYWNKKNIQLYVDSISQLLILCKTTSKILKYKLPIKNTENIYSCLHSIRKLKYRLTYFKVENKIKTDFEAITFLILELLKISILIEPILVFSALNKLNLKRNEIKVIFDYIGKIDSAISIAILRKETKNYCIPIFSKNKIELDFLSAYHPLIPDCISNSLTINKKSILLTGSNMSGKTSFIKMILINTLLAETINTCFAKHFKLSKMHLFSSIQNSDDLMSNVSSFLNEVHTVKQMINISNTTSTNLLCFDEIFRGTNTIERVAAGKAVLSFLCKFRNIVIVSTHDIDLTKLLEDTYELYHFSEQINNNEVYFDYKLKIGSLTNTNAIKLLELNDFPQMITDEAKSIANILLEKYLQIL